MCVLGEGGGRESAVAMTFTEFRREIKSCHLRSKTVVMAWLWLTLNELLNLITPGW